MSIKRTQKMYKFLVLLVWTLCYCTFRAVFPEISALGGIRNLAAFDPSATSNLTPMTQVKKNVQMQVIKCLNV